jgi:Zn-dependent M28 family amino/carboxypeptidase
MPITGLHAALRQRPRAPMLAAAWLLGACDPAPGSSAPAPEPAQVSIPRFEGAAAFALVERQVGFGPRVPGTAAHRAMTGWLEEYLRRRAESLEVQRFMHRTQAGTELELVNFWARFNRSGSRPILLVAHWDSRPTSDRASDPIQRTRAVPGANDGASGTAILLELAELMARQPPPRAVDLLLVDGEDYGDFRSGRDVLLGSRHFAAHRPVDYDPQFGVLLDMVGDRDLTLYAERNSQRLAPEVVHRIWNLAARLGHGHVFRRPARHSVQDDHIPLNESGIPTAALIDPDYAYWHTPEDTPDKLAASSLQITGEVVTHLVYGRE